MNESLLLGLCSIGAEEPDSGANIDLNPLIGKLRSGKRSYLRAANFDELFAVYYGLETQWETMNALARAREKELEAMPKGTAHPTFTPPDQVQLISFLREVIDKPPSDSATPALSRLKSAPPKPPSASLPKPGPPDQTVWPESALEMCGKSILLANGFGLETCDGVTEALKAGMNPAGAVFICTPAGQARAEAAAQLLSQHLSELGFSPLCVVIPLEPKTATAGQGAGLLNALDSALMQHFTHRAYYAEWLAHTDLEPLSLSLAQTARGAAAAYRAKERYQELRASADPRQLCPATIVHAMATAVAEQLDGVPPPPPECAPADPVDEMERLLEDLSLNEREEKPHSDEQATPAESPVTHQYDLSGVVPADADPMLIAAVSRICHAAELSLLRPHRDVEAAAQEAGEDLALLLPLISSTPLRDHLTEHSDLDETNTMKSVFSDDFAQRSLSETECRRLLLLDLVARLTRVQLFPFSYLTDQQRNALHDLPNQPEDLVDQSVPLTVAARRRLRARIEEIHATAAEKRVMLREHARALSVGAIPEQRSFIADSAVTPPAQGSTHDAYTCLEEIQTCSFTFQDSADLLPYVADLVVASAIDAARLPLSAALAQSSAGLMGGATLTSSFHGCAVTVFDAGTAFDGRIRDGVVAFGAQSLGSSAPLLSVAAVVPTFHEFTTKYSGFLPYCAIFDEQNAKANAPLTPNPKQSGPARLWAPGDTVTVATKRGNKKEEALVRCAIPALSAPRVSFPILTSDLPQFSPILVAEEASLTFPQPSHIAALSLMEAAPELAEAQPADEEAVSPPEPKMDLSTQQLGFANRELVFTASHSVLSLHRDGSATLYSAPGDHREGDPSLLGIGGCTDSLSVTLAGDGRTLTADALGGNTRLIATGDSLLIAQQSHARSITATYTDCIVRTGTTEILVPLGLVSGSLDVRAVSGDVEQLIHFDTAWIEENAVASSARDALSGTTVVTTDDGTFAARFRDGCLLRYPGGQIALCCNRESALSGVASVNSILHRALHNSEQHPFDPDVVSVIQMNLSGLEQGGFAFLSGARKDECAPDVRLLYVPDIDLVAIADTGEQPRLTLYLGVLADPYTSIVLTYEPGPQPVFCVRSLDCGIACAVSGANVALTTQNDALDAQFSPWTMFKESKPEQEQVLPDSDSGDAVGAVFTTTARFRESPIPPGLVGHPLLQSPLTAPSCVYGTESTYSFCVQVNTAAFLVAQASGCCSDLSFIGAHMDQLRELVSVGPRAYFDGLARVQGKAAALSAATGLVLISLSGAEQQPVDTESGVSVGQQTCCWLERVDVALTELEGKLVEEAAAVAEAQPGTAPGPAFSAVSDSVALSLEDMLPMEELARTHSCCCFDKSLPILSESISAQLSGSMSTVDAAGNIFAAIRGAEPAREVLIRRHLPTILTLFRRYIGFLTSVDYPFPGTQPVIPARRARYTATSLAAATTLVQKRLREVAGLRQMLQQLSGAVDLQGQESVLLAAGPPHVLQLAVDETTLSVCMAALPQASYETDSQPECSLHDELIRRLDTAEASLGSCINHCDRRTLIALPVPTEPYTWTEPAEGSLAARALDPAGEMQVPAPLALLSRPRAVISCRCGGEHGPTCPLRGITDSACSLLTGLSTVSFALSRAALVSGLGVDSQFARCECTSHSLAFAGPHLRHALPLFNAEIDSQLADLSPALLGHALLSVPPSLPLPPPPHVGPHSQFSLLLAFLSGRSEPARAALISSFCASPPDFAPTLNAAVPVTVRCLPQYVSSVHLRRRAERVDVARRLVASARADPGELQAMVDQTDDCFIPTTPRGEARVDALSPPSAIVLRRRYRWAEPYTSGELVAALEDIAPVMRRPPLSQLRALGAEAPPHRREHESKTREGRALRAGCLVPPPEQPSGYLPQLLPLEPYSPDARMSAFFDQPADELLIAIDETREGLAIGSHLKSRPETLSSQLQSPSASSAQPVSTELGYFALPEGQAYLQGGSDAEDQLIQSVLDEAAKMTSDGRPMMARLRRPRDREGGFESWRTTVARYQTQREGEASQAIAEAPTFDDDEFDPRVTRPEEPDFIGASGLVTEAVTLRVPTTRTRVRVSSRGGARTTLIAPDGTVRRNEELNLPRTVQRSTVLSVAPQAAPMPVVLVPSDTMALPPLKVHYDPTGRTARTADAFSTGRLAQMIPPESALPDGEVVRSMVRMQREQAQAAMLEIHSLCRRNMRPVSTVDEYGGFSRTIGLRTASTATAALSGKAEEVIEPLTTVLVLTPGVVATLRLRNASTGPVRMRARPAPDCPEIGISCRPVETAPGLVCEIQVLAPDGADSRLCSIEVYSARCRLAIPVEIR